MKESINNLNLMCQECSDEHKNKWQKDNKKTIINKGDFIKVEFKDKSMGEHMWIKVDKIRGDTITGYLDNIPFIVKSMKYGDYVIVKRKEIEDLDRKSKQ